MVPPVVLYCSPLLSVSAFVTRSGFHKPAFLFSTQKSNKSFRTEWSDIMTWWRVHNVPPLHALNCRQHNDPERSSAKMLLESISGPFNLPEPEKSRGEDILIALPPHCVAYIVTWIFMRHQMCRELIPVHFSTAEDSHHPHLILFIIYPYRLMLLCWSDVCEISCHLVVTKNAAKRVRDCVSNIQKECVLQG